MLDIYRILCYSLLTLSVCKQSCRFLGGSQSDILRSMSELGWVTVTTNLDQLTLSVKLLFFWFCNRFAIFKPTALFNHSNEALFPQDYLKEYRIKFRAPHIKISSNRLIHEHKFYWNNFFLSKRNNVGLEIIFNS